MTRDDDLTAREQAEFGALPRTRIPSRALEDRTVASLRARGRLRPPRLLAWPKLALATAAAVALFASGALYGQWRAESSLDTPSADASERVRQAGSAYVAAIDVLNHMPEENAASSRDAGRAAALESLQRAAGQVMLLVPDDPLAGHILSGFDSKGSAERSGEGARQIVWF